VRSPRISIIDRIALCVSNMAVRVWAFGLGMWEFRSDWTWSFYGNPELEDMYDQGRDFAHRITFRWFDNR
jgi:hypothetical protein